MDSTEIVSRINALLHETSNALEKWLGSILPRVSNSWWDDCVLNSLSYSQRDIAEKRNFTRLSDFDLAALLRIANKSWYDMRTVAYLPNSERECIREMMGVRNNWAHCGTELPGKDTILHDLKILLQFAQQINCSKEVCSKIDSLINIVEQPDSISVISRNTSGGSTAHATTPNGNQVIQQNTLGFDLSEFTTSQEIRRAENPWLNQNAILLLVDSYLQDTLGAGAYILGEGASKTLRLSADARAKVKADLRALPTSRNAVRRTWENFLNGKKPTISITFDAETAEKNRDFLFITAIHPLTKQAAAHFSTADTAYLKIKTVSGTLPSGLFPFSVYAWRYTGTSPYSKLVTICKDPALENELPDILQNNPVSVSGDLGVTPDWDSLEVLHATRWKKAKEQHLSDSMNIAMFKLESLENTHRNRVRSLEQQINDAVDEQIKRMKTSELETIQADFRKKAEDIRSAQARADIHTSLLANGVIIIEKV